MKGPLFREEWARLSPNDLRSLVALCVEHTILGSISE
jgi:hypothetical protein